jgi:hypothetical protein
LVFTKDIKEGVENIDAFANYIEENGIEKGIEQGIKRGAEQERTRMIRSMLQRGKTPEEIADLCGYSLTEINSVEEN